MEVWENCPDKEMGSVVTRDPDTLAFRAHCTPSSGRVVDGARSLHPGGSVQCQPSQTPGKGFSLWSAADWRLLPGCSICLCFQYFIMDIFKHTEQDSKSPYTYHSDSTVHILLCLVLCVSLQLTSGCLSLFYILKMC